MEYLDICDELGRPTGAVADRETVHADGILHRTSHVWVVREQDGRRQVLLQKRSAHKDSFPGMYDASAAGHIPAGEEPLASILREMDEEIGIHAAPSQLSYAGCFRCEYKTEFYGRVFHDNEIRYAYVYREPVFVPSLTLQASEVESVRWFDIAEVLAEILAGSDRICVSEQGIRTLIDYLDNPGKDSEGSK